MNQLLDEYMNSHVGIEYIARRGRVPRVQNQPPPAAGGSTIHFHVRIPYLDTQSVKSWFPCQVDDSVSICTSPVARIESSNTFHRRLIARIADQARTPARESWDSG